MDDYIAKPIEMKRIVSVFRKYIGEKAVSGKPADRRARMDDTALALGLSKEDVSRIIRSFLDKKECTLGRLED